MSDITEKAYNIYYGTVPSLRVLTMCKTCKIQTDHWIIAQNANITKLMCPICKGTKCISNHLKGEARTSGKKK